MSDESPQPANAAPRVVQPMVPSPCVGVCTLRDETCYGCGRTMDEIATWADLSAEDQAAVWAELPGRLAAFGFRSFRLAATRPVIARFIPRSFSEAAGRWRFVTPAIEAHVATGPATEPVAAVAGNLQLDAHEKVRVFGFQRDAERAGMDTAVLVLPKGLAAREAEGLSPPAAPAIEIAAPDRYSRAWLVADTADALDQVVQDFAALEWPATARRLPEALERPGIRLRLANALGAIETREPVFPDEMPGEDANGPADVKISKAFVAMAIFEADDPDWLAAALAPL
jgi:predicted Fe-S protein YdhL (DUF1289 family)